MNRLYDSFLLSLFFSITLFFLVDFPAASQAAHETYKDTVHFSKVFGRDKYYRLYLPKDYETTSEKYPVIYFFHGWGGRHFKDDNARLEYEMIKDLVDKYKVILVMWDGNIEESEPRPYNIGNHENIKYDVQMKDYFLELVAHTDATYRTLNDRNNRGIIGFSMGGLMSYYLAGKYPDKVCAAVNMTGSPEFFIGYPQNHTLYPLRYVFKNLEGVKIRMHNSTHDELVYLNEEVNKGASWEGGLYYDYWQVEGGHMVDLPGKTEVFERAMKFVVDAFNAPLPQPDRWWHYDLYPEFDVCGYHVKSTKSEPGFIFLKNVSKSGFGIHSKRWLPDGPSRPHSYVVTTSSSYQPKAQYNVIVYQQEKIKESKVTSDENGRIKLALEKDCEVGIFKEGDSPDLILLNYELQNSFRYLRPSTENKLVLKLFNRGGAFKPERKVGIELTTTDSSVSVGKSAVSADWKPDERTLTFPSFLIHTAKKPPSHGEPAWIKFHLKMKVDTLSHHDEFVVPVLFDVPKLDSIRIDDGVLVRDQDYGKGNGDGIANAGESVMVYSGYHRLRLYTDDPYVDIGKEVLIDEVVPAKWPDGFTLSSIIKINEQCPKGHVIECLASFETKGFMPIERNVTWGKVFIKVGPGK